MIHASSSCHAQGHDIRDSLYQIITPLNKMTQIPIPLSAQRFFSAFYLTMLSTSKCNQHSSVGTAAFYRLTGLEFKPSGQHNFSDPYGTAPRPTQPPVQWSLDLFPSSKEAPPDPFQHNVKYSRTSTSPPCLFGMSWDRQPVASLPTNSTIEH
jgi:hypothetical protein